MLFLAALRFEEEDLFPHYRFISSCATSESHYVWNCLLEYNVCGKERHVGVAEEGAQVCVPIGSYLSMLSG